jgi:large subunit ribosomal protein L24
MKIKTGDKVKVLSGKESVRGQIGTVLQVLTSKKKNQSYVVIEGVNMRKKHMRGQRGKSGQIIELPGPIHISNVMLIDPKTDTPTRIGYVMEGKEKKRIAKKSGEFV